MKIISYGRGMGKTIKIIKTAAANGSYIVTHHRFIHDYIQNKAKEMLESGEITQLPHPPITFKEIDRLPNDAKICIDELGLLLRQLCGGRELDMISIDGEMADIEIVHGRIV